MEELEETIEHLEDAKSGVKEMKGYCNMMFNSIVDAEKVGDIDVYYEAKAFTSLINHIVNEKAEHLLTTINNHIELITFINTFDKKYLYNAKNALFFSLRTELIYIRDLLIDLDVLTDFLEETLLSIQNNKSSIQEQLDDLLEEFSKKYK